MAISWWLYRKEKGHTMGNSLNLRCLPDGLIRGKAALRVNEVRRENSVDERRLAQTSLAYAQMS